MLKDIAEVCEKNDIKYSLSDGTLLGAVRHKGFIPWDDDIDIMMEWQEYSKFIEVAPKCFGDKYFLQNYSTDREYWLSWSKVRANNTTSMPKKDIKWNIHWGICIDVFPVIGIDKGSKEKIYKYHSISQLLLMDKYLQATNSEQAFTNKQRMLYSIPYSLRKWARQRIEKRYIKTIKWEKYCCEICRPERLYPASVFDKYSTIRFEDTDFMVINDYETYLTIQYGDYMTPPPENKRKGHALELGDIIFDTKNPYTYYKKDIC